jgi:DNA polymerase-3 subunit delta'
MPLEAFFEQTNDLDNAWLLVCSREGELDEAALAFLLRIYCAKKTGCGICPPCRKILGGIHPDVLRIKADGASIKVDDVRRVAPFIAEKAYEGGKKAVVIERAELMTTEAQNCLLKPVEEPPENTVFLLLARSESTILPTVASRCKKVKIQPLALAQCAKRIQEITGAEEEEAALYAALAEGYANEAVSLMRDEHYRGLRANVLNMCVRLCEAKNMGVSKHADFLEEEKESFATVLKIMLSFFNDLRYFMLTHAACGIKNRDMEGNYVKYSLNFTRSALSNIIDLLCEAERRLRFALNYRLMVENLLFHILEVKHSW